MELRGKTAVRVDAKAPFLLKTHHHLMHRNSFEYTCDMVESVKCGTGGSYCQ